MVAIGATHVPPLQRGRSNSQRPALDNKIRGQRGIASLTLHGGNVKGDLEIFQMIAKMQMSVGPTRDRSELGQLVEKRLVLDKPTQNLWKLSQISIKIDIKFKEKIIIRQTEEQTAILAPAVAHLSLIGIHRENAAFDPHLARRVGKHQIDFRNLDGGINILGCNLHFTHIFKISRPALKGITGLADRAALHDFANLFDNLLLPPHGEDSGANFG